MKAKQIPGLVLGLSWLILLTITAYIVSSWAIKEVSAETPDDYVVNIPVSSKYIIQPFSCFSPSGFIISGFSADSIILLARESQATLLVSWDKRGYVNYFLPKESSLLRAQVYFGDVAKNWDFVFSVQESKTELKGAGTPKPFLVFHPEKGFSQAFLFLIIWIASIILVYVYARWIWRRIKIFLKPPQKTKIITA